MLMKKGMDIPSPFVFGFRYVQMLLPEQVKQLIGAKRAQKIDGKIIKKDDKIIQVLFADR